MTCLLIIIALTSVIGYARMLYNEDSKTNWADSLDAEALTEREEIKDVDLYGERVDFDDFYFTNPCEILRKEKIVHERVCTELYNYVPLK